MAINKGKLYIVATPIGNMADITLRALETLKSVDFVLSEDTRVGKKLLDQYKINKPMISYHHHSEAKKMREIESLLDNGKNIALITDAGTPGISDPGNLLIEQLIKNDKEVIVAPIPGPCALISALSISGFPTDKFIFLGFPPHKNKRQKFFKEVANAEQTVVIYESGHRILKCLGELKEFLKPDKKIVICRELTKMFETIYRGKIDEIMNNMKDERGEFVIIIN
ncbi:MAG: 16S rRNA (cytidine(1402)-2'-O)-methyltransferase [Candidatus Magasanikbacteria bacterium CG10_big_fil_rev_8_21_14_0_10_36_32]|uniref:Ribosomal RNA small subunit methyltransferase I n=1 Tax=Candidatus Magasanikbacteria bacterium CG10_big_fil_rev_8_21_14_0_10_36_32 TaxID=1974646 RepID=A0A2M6W7R7_9BACT|nr:MAG: 16S rRNA (cytidine(1402)-2'-O)-methyltransferase [Candidatus Magasanikbacteria bacterium CG10_big_fil_rev_8_21_14_0_10_36_32]